MTKNEAAREKLSALLRARVTLIYIVSTEEARVEQQIEAAARIAGYPVRFWDCGAGLQEKIEKADAKGQTYTAIEIIDPNADPAAALSTIQETPQKNLYVLRDFHAWINMPDVQRKLKNLARTLQNVAYSRNARGESTARTIIVLTHKSEIPPELSDLATVIDWPLPERGELAEILDDAVGVLKGEAGEKIRGALVNGAREAAIDAATGLTGNGAGNAYAMSLVTAKGIEAGRVRAEKKAAVEREKVLLCLDADPRGMAGVGGLENVKAYLTQVRESLSPEGREFGLPVAKGIFLGGIPGCGKSLTAKCAAATLELPLFRLDLGGVKSKYVGESEQNIRKALAVVEAVAPCVLFIDEIEKALAGSTGPQGDGGVASDALGTILTWMQEHTGSVIVIATANDCRSLPPELLRQGRFDDVFFVDLPNARERREILVTALRQNRRDPEGIDLEAVATATKDYSGAEIAALVPKALFLAFRDGKRALRTEDLVAVARGIVPLSKTAADKLRDLRTWGAANAKPASLPESAAGASSGGRDIEL